MDDLGLQGIDCVPPPQVQGTRVQETEWEEKTVRNRSDGKYLGGRQVEIKGVLHVYDR
jgi:hypothetical protein